jgi:hypothetical protein
MTRISIFILALVSVTVMSGDAFAQMSNSPYSFSTRGNAGQPVTGSTPFQFRNRGAGSDVGMSPGYRQAIIDAEINNNRPDTLVRDGGGFLVSVIRRDGQAFLLQQAQPFLVGGGSSVGSGGFYVGYGGVSVSIWTSMASSGLPGMVLASYAGAGPSTPLSRPSPIDAWVAQLDM